MEKSGDTLVATPPTREFGSCLPRVLRLALKVLSHEIRRNPEEPLVRDPAADDPLDHLPLPHGAEIRLDRRRRIPVSL